MAKLHGHLHISLNALEENLSKFKLEDYIADCERKFADNIKKIALDVIEDPEHRAVFVSGPTSSGKTTSTGILADRLELHGKQPIKISMDDYYKTGAFDTDEYGRYDYESLGTLNLELFNRDMEELLAGESVVLPEFDFKTRGRNYKEENRVSMQENSILLVEGLHSLSEKITGHFPEEQWHGVFIMPYMTLTDDQKLLDSRDVRIIRRMIRDTFNRGANALSTIDYWPMLDKAESANFPAYLENADVYINSALGYEFYCLAPLAKRILEDSFLEYRQGKLKPSPLNKYHLFAQKDLAFETADRLYKIVSDMPAVGLSFIPDGSLLKEFVANHDNQT